YVLNIYFCVSFSFWFIYLAFFLRSAADGDLHPFLHDALPISLSLAAHQLLAGPQIVTGMIARIKIIEAVQKLVNIASALHRRYRSEEHTSELQSREKLVCRLPLEKKKQRNR